MIQNEFINNIELMGNCFASSQTSKKQTKLQIKSKAETQDEKEEKLLQSYLNIDNQELKIDSYDINTTTHPAFSQISKDIQRTFPKQQFFKESKNKVTFQRLLKRIALHYPKMGYTQGINFVAGYFLLSGMSQIQAYKSFVCMLIHPKLMFFGLYEDLFPLVRLNCSLFWKLMSIKCKKFCSKIQSINLPDEMWVFQWFICFFIYNFPIEYISKIFHFILKEKQFSMVRLAVGIMLHLQKKFKNVTDQFEQQFVQCMESLKQYSYCKDQVPINAIIKNASSIKNEEIASLLTKGSDDWYQNYFTLSGQDQDEVYHRFINQKDKDRLQFFGKVKSGISIVTYQRNAESVEVIDNIEEKKVQRYLHLYQSAGQRVHSSFVRFTRRYSLHEERFNQLVDSVIIN